MSTRRVQAVACIATRGDRIRAGSSAAGLCVAGYGVRYVARQPADYQADQLLMSSASPPWHTDCPALRRPRSPSKITLNAHRTATRVLNLPFQRRPLPLKQRVSEWQATSVTQGEIPRDASRVQGPHIECSVADAMCAAAEDGTQMCRFCVVLSRDWTRLAALCRQRGQGRCRELPISTVLEDLCTYRGHELRDCFPCAPVGGLELIV